MAENICIHCGLKTTFLNAKSRSAGPVHFACMAAYDLSGEQESGDNPEDQKRDRKHRHSDQPGTEKAVPSSATVLSSDYGAARVVSGIGEFLGWVLSIACGRSGVHFCVGRYGRSGIHCGAWRRHLRSLPCHDGPIYSSNGQQRGYDARNPATIANKEPMRSPAIGRKRTLANP